MNTPPTLHASGDIHAELDRLDRELETLRTRLAHEQGVLHEARARCRRLSERPSSGAGACEPADGATLHSGRRLARTSRLESTLAGSRPALRAIRGGGDDVVTRTVRPSRPAPEAREWDGPPDAA